MARKKVVADAVNPLQRMFGAFLRLERTRLQYTSAQIAGRLALSDTYLRLAESGRAALNQSLVFKIIEVFADSNAQTHDSRTINFTRLALFLVGMHWLGAEMAARPGKNSGLHAMQMLAAGVSDFQVFYDKVKGYFDVENGTGDEERDFLERVAVPQVGEFLRNDTYGQRDTQDIEKRILPIQNLLDLPTLNIDILLDLKQHLTGRSFVHTTDVASKWELQRAPQFLYERGLFRDYKLIISEDNLNNFHYDHLSEKFFREVQMIFVHSDEQSESQLKNEFVTRLNAGRAKANLEPFRREDVMKKLRFVLLTDAEQSSHREDLAKLWRRNTDAPTPLEHDAFWSFETRSGLRIGFVGWHHNTNPDSTRNLTLRDSLEKDKLFEHIWESVHATRKH